MVDKPKGNLDSARIHSRRIGRDPSVREARRDNKKPRKAMPPQGQPTPPSLTLAESTKQRAGAEQEDRLDRMRQASPQPKGPPIPTSPKPARKATMEDIKPFSSLNEEQQKLLRMLTLKAAFEDEALGGFVR